ncbi:MAG: hypothetical protein GF355_08345 [Candidatus Eisenbacteria bacterium]|nr:hypothetical protein [Candidatus Eisenbacteria bacterium]
MSLEADQGGRGIRMLAWEDVLDRTVRRGSPGGALTASEVSHASVGIVHSVPAPLRGVGCMWLEEGDESRRCGAPVTWTMGLSLELSRFYCEEHGGLIYNNGNRERERKRRRRMDEARRRAAEAEPAAV